jgi:hypothetical protein
MAKTRKASKSDKLWKAIDHDCPMKHCKDLTKRRNKLSRSYDKAVAKKCPKKLPFEESFACGEKFYNASEYKKVFEKWAKCRAKNCSKELKEYRQDLMKGITLMGFIKTI